MAQRIKRLVAVRLPAGKFDITVYVEGTDGDPDGVQVFTEQPVTNWDTALKAGLLLVGQFPEIDLPTS